MSGMQPRGHGTCGKRQKTITVSLLVEFLRWFCSLTPLVVFKGVQNIVKVFPEAIQSPEEGSTVDVHLF